jgi:hypothetical protein
MYGRINSDELMDIKGSKIVIKAVPSSFAAFNGTSLKWKPENSFNRPIKIVNGRL